VNDISAARLRIHAPRGAASRVQAATEEALRLAAPDDGRLLVLRRLDLGRLSIGAHPVHWAARADARLREAATGAVHGATSDAFRAQAVWFRSRDEARALLLTGLAAGRTPFAWFWRLAVPDWQGMTLPAWLPVLAAEAERSPARMVALSLAVRRIAEAGQLPALVAAFRMNAVAQAPLTVATPAGPGPATEEMAAAEPGALVERVLARQARLPDIVLRAFLTQWQALPPHHRVAAFLARLALVIASPELAAHPGALVEEARLLLQLLHAPPASPPPGSVPRTASATTNQQSVSESTNPSDSPVATGNVATATLRADATRRFVPEPEVAPVSHEQRSAAAGLWLLVGPFEHMRLGAWLAARPDLAAAGFGRALLRHIAQRHRVGDDDAVFALLPEPVVGLDPASLAAWRIGLDRWLRRQTCRRLADLVHRPGWLATSDAALRVRFRLDQADIALRRRALDVDPGWVDWLGLEVTYAYRDEAP
jgi:hypothetical protein